MDHDPYVTGVMFPGRSYGMRDIFRPKGYSPAYIESLTRILLIPIYNKRVRNTPPQTKAPQHIPENSLDPTKRSQPPSQRTTQKKRKKFKRRTLGLHLNIYRYIFFVIVQPLLARTHLAFWMCFIFMFS